MKSDGSGGGGGSGGGEGEFSAGGCLENKRRPPIFEGVGETIGGSTREVSLVGEGAGEVPRTEGHGSG